MNQLDNTVDNNYYSVLLIKSLCCVDFTNSLDI